MWKVGRDALDHALLDGGFDCCRWSFTISFKRKSQRFLIPRSPTTSPTVHVAHHQPHRLANHQSHNLADCESDDLADCVTHHQPHNLANCHSDRHHCPTLPQHCQQRSPRPPKPQPRSIRPTPPPQRSPRPPKPRPRSLRSTPPPRRSPRPLEMQPRSLRPTPPPRRSHRPLKSRR